MLSPEKNADLLLKHLEMIQAVVLRMSTYSANAKNICVTITIAAVGFAISRNSGWFVLFALIPVFIFWLIDSQYLRLERRFRCLFDETRQFGLQEATSFSLDIASVEKVALFKVAASWSVLSFYGLLALGVVLASIIIGVLR